MKTNKKHWVIAMALALFVVLASWRIGHPMLIQAAQQDVLASVPDVTEANYNGSRISLSHGFIVSFEIEGNSELSRTVWYLFPWRKIIVEM